MLRITTLALGSTLALAAGCAGDDPPEAMKAVRSVPPESSPSDSARAEPAATAPRVEGTRLSGKQISGSLVGRELVARNLDTDTVNTVWLTPDKRVKWVKGDRITFGAWRVEGDRLCFRYDDPQRQSTCTAIYRQARGEFLSVVDGQPRVRITYSKGGRL